MPLSKTALITLSLTAGIATVASHPVAWSQQTPPAANTPATSTPTLKVTTQLTVVDVTVTDAKGKPVRGLTQSDFTLKEDGKPQSLRSFQQYGTDTPSTQPAPPALPPNVYTNQQPATPTTSAVNILLIDTLNIYSILGPQTARQQALSYLKNMPAGTQVAIMELANQLRVVQGFTTDREVLLAAMNSITPKPVLGNGSPSSLQETCSLLDRRSQRTLAALNQISAFVSDISGRKNLVWFTAGVPQLTSLSMLRSYISCISDYTPQLQRTYGLLTAAQVALYPTDPTGLRIDHTPMNTAPQLSPKPIESFGDHIALDRDSLRDLAEATGGTAYFSRNDIDAAIGEAIATGSDYYALSYTPPNIGYDGKYHKIEVSVDRPGVHLEYRKGYTSVDLTKTPPPTQSASNQPASKKKSEPPPPPDAAFLAAMAHGAPDATQLLFIVRAQPSATPATPPAMGTLDDSIQNKHLVRYDLQYVLYPDEITVADTGGAHKATVRCDAAVYDAEGKPLNVLSQTLNATLKPDEVARFNQTPFRFSQQLDLPPGKLFLRVGILDNTTQKQGTLEIPLTVPPK